MPPLAALLLFAAVSACAQGEKTAPPLLLKGRVACDGRVVSGAETIPRNTLLVMVNTPTLSKKGSDDWLTADLPLIVNKLNQLLRLYGLGALKAQAFDLEKYARVHYLDSALGLNYQRNSYSLVLQNDGYTKPLGGTTPSYLCPASYVPSSISGNCSMKNALFGHYYEPYDEQTTVNLSRTTDPKADRQRRATYVAALAIHEFLHAAHMRLLAQELSGAPASPPSPCAQRIEFKDAMARTEALKTKLQLFGEGLHQRAGILAPGGVLKGNPSANEHIVSPGEKFVYDCIFDEKNPSSTFADLQEAFSSGVKCLGDVKFSEFLYLPPENRKLLAASINKRAGMDCYSACLYGFAGADAPKR